MPSLCWMRASGGEEDRCDADGNCRDGRQSGSSMRATTRPSGRCRGHKPSRCCPSLKIRHSDPGLKEIDHAIFRTAFRLRGPPCPPLGAAAILDGVCACRHRASAGRDEETSPRIEQRNWPERQAWRRSNRPRPDLTRARASHLFRPGRLNPNLKRTNNVLPNRTTLATDRSEH
jgi:hypothetical protein